MAETSSVDDNLLMAEPSIFLVDQNGTLLPLIHDIALINDNKSEDARLNSEDDLDLQKNLLIIM